MQGDVDALKAALAGEDDDAVKTAFDKLNQSQGKLGEAIYASARLRRLADAAAPRRGRRARRAPTATPSDEDVVDAEVVDDEDEKK